MLAAHGSLPSAFTVIGIARRPLGDDGFRKLAIDAGGGRESGAWADLVKNFRYLSGDSTTEPVSVKVYNTARAAPTPALNALTTLLLVASLLAVGLGFLGYRWFTRGEKGGRSLDVFAGEA